MSLWKKQNEPSSAEIAENRLSLILKQDRINLRSDQKEEMQQRLYDVVQEFMPNIDLSIEITYDQENIPEVNIQASRSMRK